jgi:UDP-N-acetylglucosamine diphosphorylase/glucosamine-1-phosphate N-acetyltransferase
MDKLIVIIMAGGLGKRMNSDLPKVLHKIGNTPMLIRVLQQAFLLNPIKIFIVVGKYKKIIEDTIQKYYNLDLFTFVHQSESLGTGNAILCCKDYLYKYIDHKVLILSGDVPLLSSVMMKDICLVDDNVVITVQCLDDPTGYGRIIVTDNNFVSIKEDKDATDIEKKIKLVNCGVYIISTNYLIKYISQITNNNAQNEYYLTDIIELIKNNEKVNINMFIIPDEKKYQLLGVNTPDQLVDLEKYL